MNNSLKDKFLYFCNAENEEDYFSKTLIYLCESNSDGSFGIIINRTVEIRLKDFFSSASEDIEAKLNNCLLYTSPRPRDHSTSRMPSSA